MAVTGKFRVGSLEDRGETQCFDYSKGESGTMPQVAVALYPVAPGHDEDFDDASYYRSTPQGKIEMVIQNPDAAEQFQVGDSFYVTFEKA